MVFTRADRDCPPKEDIYDVEQIVLPVGGFGGTYLKHAERSGAKSFGNLTVPVD